MMAERGEMDKLEEIRERDMQEILVDGMWVHHCPACSDRRWLLAEVDKWRAGYTSASNERDQEREKWIVANHEVERLRAALYIFANEQNWWITDPRTAEWAGDDEEPWRIARLALGKEE